MSFRKLEVYGFKSFADKLEVKFDDGITAIVGPNGCGKSNVADAMRWVMGEQSSRLLRCSKMSELIFNGTEKRKSLSYCEVSIHFDNSNRSFNIEYDTIVISRKMYRDDTSEYFINNTLCRLKDIQNLLRDSGLGRDGYAIIGQGKIDEILSAKPEDRRSIFEEAAGISKVKAKKLESERRLERTRNNISRLNDIVVELERQLGPLTNQAQTARKYLDFKERLKDLEINSYLYQFESISEVKKRVNKKLEGINQEIELKTALCESAAKAYEECLAKIDGVDEYIREQHEQLMAATVDIEKQAGELRLLIEKHNNLTQRNEDLAHELLELNQDLERSHSESTYLDEKLAQKKELKDELSAQLTSLSAQYQELSQRLMEGEGAQEERNLQILEAADKLADIKSNMSRLLAERDALSDKKSELCARIVSTKEKVDADNAALLEHERLIGNVTQQKASNQQKSNSLSAEYNEAMASSMRLAAEIDELNKEHHYLEAQYKMFERLINEYEGYQKSVKLLLTDAAKDAQLAKHIEGVVAQKIRVPQRIETAIETALGNALQYIITGTDDDAQVLIERLKSKKYGRITFLPMNTMKPRNLERSFRVLLGRSGCLGVADELIEFDPKYSNVFSNLLGSTVIVESMDDAMRLAHESRFGFRIVTLDGEIVATSGSITGGSRKEENTYLLSHEREIKTITDELNQNERILKDRIKKRADFLEISKSITSELKHLNEVLHENDVLRATLNEKVTKLRGEIALSNESVVLLEHEERVATARLDEILADLNSVEELEALLKSQKTSASESRQSDMQEFDALRKKTRGLNESIMDLRVHIASTESQITSTMSDIERVKAHIEELRARIENALAQQNSNIQALAQNNAMRAEFERRLVSTDNPLIKELRQKIANSDTHKKKLQEDLAEYNAKQTTLTQNLAELSKVKAHEELFLQNADENILDLQERIESEYQLTHEMCAPFRQQDFDHTEALAEMQKIRRQIYSLGNVNVNAIEECKEVGARYEEKAANRDDLLKAEQNIMSTIAELEKEALERFTTEFKKIADNFKVVFREMFGGGTARLELLDNENPLEAGVEIMAEPPGKKLTSISPLSGGERALTAIAILFSILKLKPMPFCVLDEIEAALDDSNAQRFARYLHKFSAETQFIVITHRKPTMELADNLYGVTMEEKGVSRIISVKLSDAINASEAV